MKQNIIILTFILSLGTYYTKAQNSNATVYPVNIDFSTNVTCHSGDTIHFYTVNWTMYQFDLYINQNLIANNLTPGVGGKIYDYVAQIGDTSYTLTNNNGQFFHKSIYVNPLTTDLQVTEKRDVVMYPNPSNNNFTIETNTLEINALQILDVTGKMVLSQNINNKTSIDVSGLDNGVYFVKTNDNIFTQKIIVQH